MNVDNEDKRQPVVDRNELIELLIATRTQSEGVTADLIIKLLAVGKENKNGSSK